MISAASGFWGGTAAGRQRARDREVRAAWPAFAHTGNGLHQLRPVCSLVGLQVVEVVRPARARKAR
jgi:hypothetical protein